MKVMFVDIAITGHHLPYLTPLVSCKEYEAILVIPQNVETLNCKQYTVKSIPKSFGTYKNWLQEVYECAEKEKPDIIHFLTGDVFFRYFGFGLQKLKKYKKILTFHRIKEDVLGCISTKIISCLTDKIILHSDYMKTRVEKKKIINVCHIEYPVFGGQICDVDISKKHFGLSDDVKVIGCIGGTRYDKGIDIILEALKYVTEPFQLLIAGKPDDFTAEYIESQISSYREKVCLKVGYLSEDELKYAMNAIDILALPYRKIYNGASGLLSEAIALDKCAIGPMHGNLGDTISKNHLGYIFEAENIYSLAKTISGCLSESFNLDENYLTYKESLNVDFFVTKHCQHYKEL